MTSSLSPTSPRTAPVTTINNPSRNQVKAVAATIAKALVENSLSHDWYCDTSEEDIVKETIRISEAILKPTPSYWKEAKTTLVNLINYSELPNNILEIYAAWTGFRLEWSQNSGIRCAEIINIRKRSQSAPVAGSKST